MKYIQPGKQRLEAIPYHVRQEDKQGKAQLFINNVSIAMLLNIDI